MDNKQVMKWIVGAVARGVAWVLVAKLGLAAAESSELGVVIAEAAGALVLAGISIYSSVAGRKVLKESEP